MKLNKIVSGWLLFYYALLLIPPPTFCQDRLPALISDDMALQRDANIKNCACVDIAEGANLYNYKEGLPASPFTTEEFGIP